MESIVEKDTYTPYFASQIAILAVLYFLIVILATLATKVVSAPKDIFSSPLGIFLLALGVMAYLLAGSRIGMLFKVIKQNKGFTSVERCIRRVELCLVLPALFITPLYPLYASLL